MRSNDSLKVIVVGIPKTLDDSSLSELFAHYGSVADAKVVLDVNTNASRGFGFVTFTAQAAMRRAIKEMDKKQLEGRTLNVRQLVPKDTFTKDAGKSAGVSDLAKRPCYLLRKGKCNKGDRCPFSHEIKSGEFGSCFEFVQNGFCKRGDQCKFFHPAVAEEDEDGEENGDHEHEEEKPYAKKAEVKKATEPAVAAAVKNTKADAAKDKSDPKKELKKPKDDKPRYCFAYQTGRCHRGKRCLFLHEKLEVPEHEAPPPPAAAPKKRPSDFEVVTEDEPSKKRQRESQDEEEEEETESEEEVEEEKPVAPVKAVKAKKEVVEKKPLKTKTKAEPQVEEVKEPEVYEDKAGKVHTGPKPICRHFLKGSCKRGRICFFLHERPAKGEEAETTQDVVMMAEQTDATTEETNGAPPQQAVASFFANFNSDAGVFVPSATPAATVAAVTTAAKSPVKTQTKKPNAKVVAVAAETSPAKVLKRKLEDTEERVEPTATEEAAEDGEIDKDVDGGADRDGQEEEVDADAVAAPVAAAPRAKKQRYSSEWVDMGAAFDGADSDDQKRKAGGRRQPRQKVTKEQMKANREKLREERRAKRAFKTQARERLLRGEGEIELDA